jgi:hypothetical protein
VGLHNQRVDNHVVQPLAGPAWRGRREAHHRRVDAWVLPHLNRRRGDIAHPVEDFLFTYYTYRPVRLRRWHPGVGVALVDAEPTEFGPAYRRAPDRSVVLDTRALVSGRGDSFRRIHALLAATAGRIPQLGCFGLHEWAMVYRQAPEKVRHNAWPLRLAPREIAAVVEERGVRCTHIDAYRFFTPAARPLNLLTPTRATQVDDEQPGCLHANMDLYKWAYKLAPLPGAELVADCFALAREIRALDMRASPYDLAALGYPPVRIETSDGRAEYAAAQRDFAERAATLRLQLLRTLGTAGVSTTKSDH